MPSLYKAGAAVCLIALAGFQPAAAQDKNYKFTAIEVKEDAYLAANLARNGKLPVRISEVAKSEDLVNTVKEIFEEEKTDTLQTCEKLIKESELKNMFHYAFDYKTDTTPVYHELLQQALTAGLNAFR
ncbi:hypothetical protein EBH_0073610 [Eimeria brunetti]|uniref:SAG family member n=1 Tax=Eimeria brunetti TaxID=51314 RepID=U6LUN1_9EIME|nr:hypothetical protein EBH_0073610 [Eimeria brunetti]